MDQIYLELQRLGFSMYESKAYVGLLQHSPVTGYEISKRTGVPRSMIYEVLGKLVDRGAVYTVPSEPVKYAPVPAKELIRRLRSAMDQTFDYLETALHSVQSDSEVDVIWHVRGSEHVVQEMVEMIEKAQEECWISVWEPQVHAIKEPVERSLLRDVNVFSIVFGAENETLGHTFYHNYMPPDVVKQRMGGHLTIVARDNQEVLIAHFSENETPWAVKTQDRALVQVAIEYIRHDIMIEEVTRELGADKLDRLWRNNPTLVHVVAGNRST
jgi:sugar-specific transcriptional regulator TrmB